MHKWRPSVVSAVELWTVNDQIMIVKFYCTEILNMAHDAPMSGHLVINKTYRKLSNHFVCLALTSDVSNYCWFYHV